MKCEQPPAHEDAVKLCQRSLKPEIKEKLLGANIWTFEHLNNTVAEIEIFFAENPTTIFGKGKPPKDKGSGSREVNAVDFSSALGKKGGKVQAEEAQVEQLRKLLGFSAYQQLPDDMVEKAINATFHNQQEEMGWIQVNAKKKSVPKKSQRKQQPRKLYPGGAAPPNGIAKEKTLQELTVLRKRIRNQKRNEKRKLKKEAIACDEYVFPSSDEEEEDLVVEEDMPIPTMATNEGPSQVSTKEKIEELVPLVTKKLSLEKERGEGIGGHDAIPLPLQVPKSLAKVMPPFEKSKDRASRKVLQALGRFPTNLSIWDALALSKELREAFIAALQEPEIYEAHVAEMKEEMYETLTASMTFTEDDMLLPSSCHNRPLYMRGQINGRDLDRILVNAVEVCVVFLDTLTPVLELYLFDFFLVERQLDLSSVTARLRGCSCVVLSGLDTGLISQ
ncbi:hypothetical protein Taro_020960 [Colocasia esculenta]|uniref:Uncharacterized protein n=1 Tax=Colocasia esculenta TaxID=4460 RepID=A0A843V3Y5_COLES|nr:hypothetical protein [Colocasia esculenta]